MPVPMPAPQSTVKIFHSTDGTEIFAEATGSPQNPSVVLLSGLSLSGAVYDSLCADERLLNTLYIVRYDMRGHARSGKPTTSEAYESKRFAEDFQTVVNGFGLHKPVLAGWSIGAAIAADIAAHLAPSTLAGVVYLAGIPCTGEIALEMVAPALVAALPGLTSKDDVAAFQAASAAFTNMLFARPDSVPYAVKCMYMGHSMPPEVMLLSLGRPTDVEKLWAAGRDGLPLLVLQGTADAHRLGGKGVDEVMRPHFTDYEYISLEGRGHALHYECPDEVVDALIRFTERVKAKA